MSLLLLLFDVYSLFIYIRTLYLKLFVNRHTSAHYTMLTHLACISVCMSVIENAPLCVRQCVYLYRRSYTRTHTRTHPSSSTTATSLECHLALITSSQSDYAVRTTKSDAAPAAAAAAAFSSPTRATYRPSNHQLCEPPGADHKYTPSKILPHRTLTCLYGIE